MALRVAAISFVPFGSDSRSHRIAEALALRGDEVSVFSPGNVAPPNGVEVRTGSTFALIRAHLDKPFDLVIVHAPPDLRLLAAMVPRIFGPKLLLDLGAVPLDQMRAARALSLLADATLASSTEQYNHLLHAGVPTYSLHVVTDFLDPKVFTKREKDPRIEKGATVQVVTHRSLGDAAVKAAQQTFEAAQAIDPRFVLAIVDGGDRERADQLQAANIALCMPSSAQIPQALFEDLAIGLPTIATKAFDAEAIALAADPTEAAALLIKLAKEPKSREKLALGAKAWTEAFGAPKQTELIYRAVDFLCIEKVLAEKRARQASQEHVKTGSKKTPPKSAS